MRHSLATLGKEKFSAIGADIMLPGLDGYSFVTTLSSDSRFKDLCVIAVSSVAHEKDRDKAMAAGPNDYPVKPVLLNQITEVVRRCLKGA